MAATHVTPGWYFQAADESICTQGRTAVRAAGLCLCVSHFRSSVQPLFRFQSHLPLCIRLGSGSVAGGALPQGQAVWRNAWGGGRVQTSQASKQSYKARRWPLPSDRSHTQRAAGVHK